jgi:hypothetical protein
VRRARVAVPVVVILLLCLVALKACGAGSPNQAGPLPLPSLTPLPAATPSAAGQSQVPLPAGSAVPDPTDPPSGNLPCKGTIGAASAATLVVSGACQLTVSSPLTCVIQPNGTEMSAQVQGKLPSGSSVTLSLDFEVYPGPGNTVNNVPVYVYLHIGTTLDWWYADSTVVTINPDGSLTFVSRLGYEPGTPTPHAPVLVDGTLPCTYH